MRDREVERHRYRDRGIQRDRERETGIQRYREKQRQCDREAKGHIDRDREREILMGCDVLTETYQYSMLYITEHLEEDSIPTSVVSMTLAYSQRNKSARIRHADFP